MKNSKVFVICLLCILCVFNTWVESAKKGSGNTPPGQAKKQGQALPPGQAKKQGLSTETTLPPGQAKKQKIPSMKSGEKAQQEWCLEQNGKVNVVLSDRTICSCLTETHAVVFASEDNWLESIGKSLYSAVLMETQPGIVLFMEQEEENLHIQKVNDIIARFDLPITTWLLEIEASDEEDEKDSETEKFNVTTSVEGSGGSIKPFGTKQVPKGASISIKIQPDSGDFDDIADVTVNGVSVKSSLQELGNGDGHLVIHDVTEDLEIVATFSQN